MEGHWNHPDLPHKGWLWLYVEDGKEPIYECEMCGKQGIRYLHTLHHPETGRLEPVGSVCAEKMAKGYQGQAKRRLVAQGRSWEARLARWTARTKWRSSKNGNPWRSYRGFLESEGLEYKGHVVLFRRSGAWWAKVDGRFSTHGLPTFEAAAKAVFCHLWPRPHRYSI